MTTKQNKGFTLLEILLVIAAIGILAAIVLVAINPNRQLSQARNTVRQADINTIQKAVEQYLIENGSYPSSITTTPGYICNTGTEQVGGSTNCSGRVDLRELVPDYIAGIPKDPQATGTSTGYIVAINPDNNKVSIQASLSERGILVINPLSIVTNGLVLNLDAGNPASYPGTGNTWFDLSGNSNNGTLVNGVGYNTANGGSLSFDGVDDRIDMSPNNFNLSEFSVNIWFKTNDITTDYLRLIHKADTTGSTKGFLIASSQTNGKLVFVYQPNYTTGEVLKRSTNLITTSTWYNTTMTYNSTSGMKIYFNSVEDAGETSTSPDVGWSSNTGNLFSVGSRAGGTQHYNGNISQVSIYNRALTTEEIQQNFNATRGRFGL